MKRVAAAICTLSAAASVFGAEIVLRNGQVISAPIEAIAYDGVSIGGDAPRMLGWDAVYYATGEQAEDVSVYSEFSDTVWRAKSRLQRGDYRLASPLFEELFERQSSLGIAGPTGLLIAEGTLRCRVASGQHTDALEAWGVALQIRQTGQRQSGETAVAGLIDPETSLVPTLPPVWLEGAVDAGRFAETGAGESMSSAKVIDLYRAAARRSLGETPDVEVGSDGLDSGEELVAQMIRATSSDENARIGARVRLLALIESSPGTWKEAWARVAVGRSFLMEPDERSRDAGVLHLLHLPARFERSQPHLAAVALAEVGREMHARGEEAVVELMRNELRAQFPQHGANAWLQAVSGN